MDTAHTDIRYELLQGVLGAVRVGVIVLDHEQRVVLWNDWIEQHSRRAAAETCGKSFFEIFPELVDTRTHVAIEEALRNNFSSLISQTLNKAPFPLYSTPADQALGVRMQQAVHVMPIEVPGLPRHCLVQISDVSMAVARDRKLREQAVELQSQTLIDGLTGIANRRRFDAHLQHEFRRAKRTGAPLSLIMIDVDHFKDYNDNYGHQQGDQCLLQVAHALQHALRRPSDLVARYGGEEFTAVLPDTSAEGALSVAEAMRAEVKALALAHAHSGTAQQVTISLGIATRVPEQADEPGSLIDAADRALYRAKRSGRDCIAVHGDAQNAA